MMSTIVAAAILLAAGWFFVYFAVLALKIYKASPARIDELKTLQGGMKNIVNGKLGISANSCDYRVVQGLEWDGKKYTAQSRLSTEAVRAAFFN